MSLALPKVIRIIEEFRKLDSEMQAQTMLTLLFIARKGELGSPPTVREVGEYLGVTGASASRNVASLSKHHRHNKAGHDLVYTYENPEKRIEKFIELTPKGKRVINSLEDLVTLSHVPSEEPSTKTEELR